MCGSLPRPVAVVCGAKTGSAGFAAEPFMRAAPGGRRISSPSTKEKESSLPKNFFIKFPCKNNCRQQSQSCRNAKHPPRARCRVTRLPMLAASHQPKSALARPCPRSAPLLAFGVRQGRDRLSQDVQRARQYQRAQDHVISLHDGCGRPPAHQRVAGRRCRQTRWKPLERAS